MSSDVGSRGDSRLLQSITCHSLCMLNRAQVLSARRSISRFIKTENYYVETKVSSEPMNFSDLIGENKLLIVTRMTTDGERKTDLQTKFL